MIQCTHCTIYNRCCHRQTNTDNENPPPIARTDSHDLHTDPKILVLLSMWNRGRVQCLRNYILGSDGEALSPNWFKWRRLLAGEQDHKHVPNIYWQAINDEVTYRRWPLSKSPLRSRNASRHTNLHSLVSLGNTSRAVSIARDNGEVTTSCGSTAGCLLNKLWWVSRAWNGFKLINFNYFGDKGISFRTCSLPSSVRSASIASSSCINWRNSSNEQPRLRATSARTLWQRQK